MVNFIILLISHFVGDFYLQTTRIARCKNAQVSSKCGNCIGCKSGSRFNMRYVMVHALLYVAPFLVMFLITDYISALISLAVILISHVIVDVISCCFNKNKKQTIVFIVDQSVHIGILFLIYKVCIFNSFFVEYSFVLKVLLAVLIVVAPCSIFINKLFKDVFPDTEDKGIFDVGSIIGILERMLVLIFAYFESFATIAIIITVKTWARNIDLQEKDFRNKYLLGTLASLVLALVIYAMFKLMKG